MASPWCFTFQLPGFTTPGNAVIVGFTSANQTAAKVTDDKGDSYTILASYYDGSDKQQIGIAGAFNVAAGARVINVCFNSDPGWYVEPMATELANVIGVDGKGTGNNGSGASISAGNLTPSQSGDLIYQVAASLTMGSYGRPQSSFTAGPNSQASWNLLSADLQDGWAAQYGIAPTTGALNPMMSLGTPGPWVSAAALLKTGNSGSVPAGLRIVHLDHENLPSSYGGGSNGTPVQVPVHLQFPSSGNLLVIVDGGGSQNANMTGATDTTGNTWAQAGQDYGNYAEVFYAENANSSTSLGLTAAYQSGNFDGSLFLYDIAGAAISSALDMTNGATGSWDSFGPLTMPYTITTSASNEIVFSEIGLDYNTVGGMMGGQLVDTNVFSGMNQSGPEPVDQNNGWGHVIATSPQNLPIIWTFLFSGVNVDTWSAISAAFKSAP